MRKGFIATVLGIFFSAGLVVSCGGGTSTQTVEAQASTADSSALEEMLTIRLPLPDSLGVDGAPARSYDTISMGRMAVGERLQGRFRVVNTSDKPLVIVEVITGCGCTTADYDPSPLAPGEGRVMTWQFDSRGRFGQQFKSIEIVTAERQCATVYLDGEVYIPQK